MEELGSLCNYEQDLDGLKLELQYTTMELEIFKREANQQIREHSEEIEQLLNLLKLACRERDEARDELQNLMNKFIPQYRPQSENLIATTVAKANSSITESNSLSDAYNHHHSLGGCSSPVDSFLDTVTSPDYSTIKMVDPSKMIDFVKQQSNVSMVTNTDAVIDNLTKFGKILPQKGKLLQAVMEAGPLLQTLMVAGPIPRWKNPPPLKTFKIPTVSINGASCSKSDRTKLAWANPNRSVGKLRLSHCSASILNFGNSGNSQMLNTSGADVNVQLTGVKRRKVSMS